MNENEQNRNNFNTKKRILATYDFANLWLYPWNDERILYYMQSVVTAIFIYDGNVNKQGLINAMYDSLNQRLDQPLNENEQQQAIELIPQYLKEGRL